MRPVRRQVQLKARLHHRDLFLKRPRGLRLIRPLALLRFEPDHGARLDGRQVEHFQPAVRVEDVVLRRGLDCVALLQLVLVALCVDAPGAHGEELRTLAVEPYRGLRMLAPGRRADLHDTPLEARVLPVRRNRQRRVIEQHHRAGIAGRDGTEHGVAEPLGSAGKRGEGDEKQNAKCKMQNAEGKRRGARTPLFHSAFCILHSAFGRRDTRRVEGRAVPPLPSPRRPTQHPPHFPTGAKTNGCWSAVSTAL